MKTMILATLRQRILDKIYGQDKAVDKVVEAVMMAKAGLVDDDKPMASLLFVVLMGEANRGGPCAG